MSKAEYGHKPIRNEATGDKSTVSFKLPDSPVPELGCGIGLHNLMQPADKAIALHKALMENIRNTFVGNVNSRSELARITEMIPYIIEQFYCESLQIPQCCIKVYTYCLEGSSNLTIVPCNLISLVLLHGRDIPPIPAPKYGVYEGEHFIYTVWDSYSEDRFEGKVPLTKIEPKLTT